MDEESNKSLKRRYDDLINNDSIDQRNLSIFTTRTDSSKKRHNPISKQKTVTEQLPINDQDFIYDGNLSMNMTKPYRKRPAQDDQFISLTASSFFEHQQLKPKRPRYEHSKSTESENQPPRSINSFSRSLFQSYQNNVSSTWNNLVQTNDISSMFPTDIALPMTRATTETYYRINNTPDHQENCTSDYPLLLTEHHRSTINCNNSLILSNEKSTISNSSKANFLLDSKQQMINRTGNISPAHSDSSSESTSTCSSDEQLHHHYHFHHQQPWRSYRERENYEQLLDLAEKLSDPNRFNQVDIEQFLSYRYKTSITTSKQTACVICMSHFKNGQHIRVLPCQHEYHSKCIARWFTMNSSCPICRRDNFLSC